MHSCGIFWRVLHENWRLRKGFGIVQIVGWSDVRRVWFEEVDAYGERFVFSFVDEFGDAIAEVGCLGVFDWERCGEGSGEDHCALRFFIGFVAEADEPVVIVAEGFVVLWIGVPDAVLVFDRVPFVPAFSLDHFVAQMPLAVVGGVVVVREKFGEGFDVLRERDVVFDAAVCVRP